MTNLALAFIMTAQALNLPTGLQSALCFVESNHKVKAINVFDGGSPSLGVCQIKLATAKGVGFTGTAKELQETTTNVYYAGKYLKQQLKRYGGDIRKGVAAYNAGAHRENANGLTMNRKYVSKVFKAWAENR